MASVLRNIKAPLTQSDPTVPMKKVVRVAAPDADADGLFGKGKLEEQSPNFSTYGLDDSPSCGKTMGKEASDGGTMSWATTALGSRTISDFSTGEDSMDLSYAVGSFRPDGFDKEAKKVLLLPDESPWLFDCQETAPPPGLTKPVDITATLSPGSEKHSLGTCDPCVWYWKVEGCTRGNECGYCHLCPEGEIKKRKKQKKDSIRRSKEGAETILAETPSPQPSSKSPPLQEKIVSDQAAILASEQPDSESMEGPGGATMPQWSEGSVLHSIGQCEPCAWFWGKGCMRGQDCLRCHLCPEGELKKRKKAKVASLRKEKGKSTDDIFLEPQKISLPPGLEDYLSAKLRGLRDEDERTLESRDAELSAYLKLRGLRDEDAPPGLPAPEKPKSPLVGLPVSISQLEQTEDRDGEESPDGDMALCVDRAPQVSEGAKYHGSGNCRPCAWFWRPMGCKNGEACCHCHLCPPGELKARKKMKVLTIRQEKQCRKEDQDAEALNASGESLHMMTAPNSSLFSMPMMTGGPMLPNMMPPAMANSIHTSELASAGSSEHPYNCKPCAWFHKPKGCENGKDCRHCHLCPEREIQNRRKMKQAILRQQKDVTDEQFSPMGMGMPMSGALEQMQMQMAQWGDMQWMAQMQDTSPVNAPWEASFSPTSWMSPMMVDTTVLRTEDQDAGEESPQAQTLYEAEQSPKVALDLSTALTAVQAEFAVKQSAGPGPMGGSPRVVKIAQMLCV